MLTAECPDIQLLLNTEKSGGASASSRIFILLVKTGVFGMTCTGLIDIQDILTNTSQWFQTRNNLASRESGQDKTGHKLTETAHSFIPRHLPTEDPQEQVSEDHQ